MNCWKDWECYRSGMYQYVWSDWINHHAVLWVGLGTLLGGAPSLGIARCSMTERQPTADERPQLGNMFRVLPDRAKRTFYVGPDYFAELRTMAVSPDQQPFIDELHFLRRLMRVPEGTECRIEVVYD